MVCPITSLSCITTYDPSMNIVTRACQTTNCTMGTVVSSTNICSNSTSYPYQSYCCCYGDACNENNLSIGRSALDPSTRYAALESTIKDLSAKLANLSSSVGDCSNSYPTTTTMSPNDMYYNQLQYQIYYLSSSISSLSIYISRCSDAPIATTPYYPPTMTTPNGDSTTKYSYLQSQLTALVSELSSLSSNITDCSTYTVTSTPRTTPTTRPTTTSSYQSGSTHSYVYTTPSPSDAYYNQLYYQVQSLRSSISSLEMSVKRCSSSYSPPMVNLGGPMIPVDPPRVMTPVDQPKVMIMKDPPLPVGAEVSSQQLKDIVQNFNASQLVPL